MKRFLILICLLGWNLAAPAQTVQELEQQLKEAGSTEEKVNINYELSRKLRGPDPDKAMDYAKRAYQLAGDTGDEGLLSLTAFEIALVYERQRDDRNQEVWFRSATEHAKKAGDVDLIINSVDKRGRLALKERKEQRAIRVYRDAFEYFSNKGTSISDLERKSAQQKRKIAKEQQELELEREQLQQEVLSLLTERDRLTSRQTELMARQEDLMEEKQEVEQKVTLKDEALDSLNRQKAKAEQVAKEKEKEYRQLSREALAQKLALEETDRDLAETRANLAEAEIIAERNRYLILIAGLAAAFFIILAFLSWGRYRASRRAKKALEDKNKIIEHERERSDELLLNILPAPIAQELKEHGKARARRYEEVTVLFADFKNFTSISERLSPEALVEELDKCFKGFDFIISQYKDIEKIKTIGDAYMCAAGLTERRTVPSNLVRAALEMQEFLEEHKQENIRLGKPFFEARIGLHTGPVVAGVVGVNKFAYDIWGDTVNTAARVESNCEEGRVNISQTTYQLVRYQFECIYRGKVDAKNKGAIDMYFVSKERKAMAAAV